MIGIGDQKVLFIDAHAHVYERLKGQKFGGTPVEAMNCGRVKIGEEIVFWTDPAYFDLSSPIEVFLEHMNKNNMDKAVLLQTPCYGEQYDYIDAILEKYPGKFQTVGLADPRFREEFIRDTDIAVNQHGYFGIKIEVPDVPFIMDAQENEFVWETILRNDTYIVIDLGWGDGPYDFRIDQLANVLKKYPTIKTIIPHLGVSRLWDPNEAPNYDSLKRCLSLLEINRDNLWFDISGLPLLVRTFDEYPYPRIHDILKVVKQTIGIDKIMWGTDYPCVTEPCTYKQNFDMVDKHCEFLSQQDKISLFGANAQRVYFDRR